MLNLLNFLGEVTLPDIGVDLADLITAYGTKVGPWILAALGVGMLLYAIRRGWAFVKTFGK